MDAETFKTRFAEAFSTAIADLADTLSDQIVEMIAGDDTEAETQPGKTQRNAPPAPPAPSAAAQAAKVRSLREACKRNGREAEFKALQDSGAEIEKLQDLLIRSISTSEVEIDTTQKPASGKRGSALMSFSETARGGKAGK